MKTGIIFSGIAVALTCLTLTSCDWFTKKKTEQPKLIGKWEIDSVFNNSGFDDPITGLKFSKLVFYKKELLPATVEFKNDSSYKIVYKTGDFNSSTYYYDSIKQTAYIKDSVTTTAWQIKNLTDSSMIFFDEKDSINYSLKRDRKVLF